MYLILVIQYSYKISWQNPTFQLQRTCGESHPKSHTILELFFSIKYRAK